jgi:hypothetical protein
MGAKEAYPESLREFHRYCSPTTRLWSHCVGLDRGSYDQQQRNSSSSSQQQ